MKPIPSSLIPTVGARRGRDPEPAVDPSDGAGFDLAMAAAVTTQRPAPRSAPAHHSADRPAGGDHAGERVRGAHRAHSPAGSADHDHRVRSTDAAGDQSPDDDAATGDGTPAVTTSEGPAATAAALPIPVQRTGTADAVGVDAAAGASRPGPPTVPAPAAPPDPAGASAAATLPDPSTPPGPAAQAAPAPVPAAVPDAVARPAASDVPEPTAPIASDAATEAATEAATGAETAGTGTAGAALPPETATQPGRRQATGPASVPPVRHTGATDATTAVAATASASTQGHGQERSDAGQGGARTSGGEPVAAAGPAGGPTPVAGLLPGAQAAGPGTADAPGSASPATPAPPVADQVARYLVGVRTLRDGTHRTVLHLSPEHLGEVTITVEVRAGAVRLHVAGGDAALGALGQGMADLRSQLADAGLDLADVSLRPDAGGPGGTGPGPDPRAPWQGEPGTGADQHADQQSQQHGQQHGQPGSAAAPGTIAGGTGAGPAAAGTGHLDVRI
jgi:flagellar hook-length control protein FliK